MEARRFCNKVLTENPTLWKAHEYLARISWLRGDFDEAVHHLCSAVETVPEPLVPRLALAGLYVRRGTYHRAREQCEAIKASLDPDNCDAEVFLALIDYVQGNDEASIARLSGVVRR